MSGSGRFRPDRSGRSASTSDWQTDRLHCPLNPLEQMNLVSRMRGFFEEGTALAWQSFCGRLCRRWSLTDVQIADERHAHRPYRNIDGGMVVRLDDFLLRLDRLVLKVGGGEALAYDFRGSGDPLGLDDAFLFLARGNLYLRRLTLQFLDGRKLP